MYKLSGSLKLTLLTSQSVILTIQNLSINIVKFKKVKFLY